MKTLLFVLLTVYYCSPTGTGNGTAYNQPTSFATGLTLLANPGDTLYLRGGQYDLLTTTINLVGSSRKNIVISGYPGEKAILDFRQTAYGKRGLQFATGCEYVHLKDMTLRYSGKNNIINYGSNNTFENLDIYGSADTGCQMKTGGNNLIKNCDSHDNFDYENGGTSAADFGGNADGFADKQHSGAPNHYIGCRAWHNGDDGWDFYQRVTTSETVIENCICYDNGPAEYDMRNHPRYQVDKTWFDQIVGQTVTNRYGEQQTVTLEHYPCHGNGNGFKLGGNYTSHLVLIHHCLSVGNGANGFDHNNDAGTMRVYNNTGYLNKNMNFGFGTGTGTLSIQNCVSYLSANADTHTAQTTTVDSHNSWNNMPATAADFQSLDTTQILAARQANGELAAGTLMHLATGSKYIDAGVNLGFAYNGSAPDMGCYESDGTYHPGSDTIPDPEPIYECKPGAHQVAYLTQPDDDRDTVILHYLEQIDSLCIHILDANETGLDYSDYELLIISSVPKSTAAAIGPAEEETLPKLILKPFIYKSTIWNWGTPINTPSTSIEITQPNHVIFEGLSSPLKLFSQVNTNAVTAISQWLVSPVSVLAQVNNQYDAIAEYDNTLTIGLSEYSTAYLTHDALKLIENAIWYRMGRTKPIVPTATDEVQGDKRHPIVRRNGILYIQHGNQNYTLIGEKIQ